MDPYELGSLCNEDGAKGSSYSALVNEQLRKQEELIMKSNLRGSNKSGVN